jgi:hypothetical protein
MTKLIAYDTDDLDRQIIADKADLWHAKGALPTETWERIRANYTTAFHTPNIFIRIGGFIFCCFVVMSFGALIFQFSMGATSENSYTALLFFIGILCIVALEFIIKQNHYRSGIDDALLYAGLWSLIASMMTFLRLNIDDLPFFLTFLPLIAFAAMRYTDKLLTAIAYGFVVAVVVHATIKFPTIAPYILSFVVSFTAIALYFLSVNAQKKLAMRFWKAQLDLVEGMSLVLFYASCNYYVLQKVNQDYFQNPNVGLAPLFWFLTFAIPIFYIYQGLKQKNRLILSVGILGIAAGVATFRVYFHVMPMEIAAILAGSVLLAFAYFSMRYLKQNKTPFTYDEDSDKPFYAQAESIIIAQSLGNQSPQTDGNPNFGGGDFGGGGAGEHFD